MIQDFRTVLSEVCRETFRKYGDRNAAATKVKALTQEDDRLVTGLWLMVAEMIDEEMYRLESIANRTARLEAAKTNGRGDAWSRETDSSIAAPSARSSVTRLSGKAATETEAAIYRYRVHDQAIGAMTRDDLETLASLSMDQAGVKQRESKMLRSIREKVSPGKTVRESIKAADLAKIIGQYQQFT